MVKLALFLSIALVSTQAWCLCRIHTDTCAIAAYRGTFTDDATWSQNDQAACLNRAAQFHTSCKSTLPVTATYIQSGSVLASRGYPNTLCKITTETCPKYSSYLGTFKDEVTWSQNSQLACLGRAQQFYNTCGTNRPVIATYMVNGQPAATSSYPKTSCRIQTQACPRAPGYTGTFTDDATWTQTDQNACLGRAAQFYNSCGVDRQVSASYMVDGKMVASRSRGQVTSVKMHIGQDYTGFVTMLKEAGLRGISVDVLWSSGTINSNGVYVPNGDYITYTTLNAIGTAVSLGMKVTINLNGRNSTYGNLTAQDPRTTAARAEIARTQFALFAKGLIRYLDQRFGAGKVSMFEVTNEWNIGNSGLDGYGRTDYAGYKDVLCKTYNALKSVNSQATVIGGATSGIDYRFMYNILDLDAGRCMTHMSVHPYPVELSGLATLQLVPGGDWIQFDIGTRERLKILHDNTLLRAGKEIPIMITEDGVQTLYDTSGVALKYHSDEFQADYLSRMLYNTAQPLPYVHGFTWYDLFDDDLKFGLLRSPGVFKPSFYRYKQIAPTF